MVTTCCCIGEQLAHLWTQQPGRILHHCSDIEQLLGCCCSVCLAYSACLLQCGKFQPLEEFDNDKRWVGDMAVQYSTGAIGSGEFSSVEENLWLEAEMLQVQHRNIGGVWCCQVAGRWGPLNSRL